MKIRFKHHPFLLGRALTNSLMVSDLLSLAAISEGLPETKPLVAFYSVRVAVVILAHIIFKVKKSKSFYFPIIKEMPDNFYWFSIQMIVISIRVFYLQEFTGLPSAIKWIDMGIATTVIVSMLINLQSRPWIWKAEEKWKKTLDYLIRRAGLDEQELQSIAPILVNEIQKEQKMPWLWKITSGMLVLVWAAMLDSYASTIVDFIGSFIPLKNILPPY